MIFFLFRFFRFLFMSFLGFKGIWYKKSVDKTKYQDRKYTYVEMTAYSMSADCKRQVVGNEMHVWFTAWEAFLGIYLTNIECRMD